MYVDRFRFANEPGRLAVASRPVLHDVVRRLRHVPGLVRRAGAIRRAYGALGDSHSRLIFRDLLVYRYFSPRLTQLANNKVKFEQLESTMSAIIESASLKEPVRNSLGEALRLWFVRYNDIPLEVVTSRYGLYWMLHSDQYYLRRAGVFVGPQNGDVILDCGSHVGDTSLRFAIDVGPNGKVFGFDPDPKHVAICRENAARNQLDSRMSFLACGISDRVIQGHSQVGEGESWTINAGRRLSSSDASISIDVFCEQQGLIEVNYIKMDIEGSEMKGLRGADRTIQRCRPKLAICVYHRPVDLWEITSYIAERYPFYRLFLGHHSLHDEETVLYARQAIGES
jgi:FkbM family methyltransferase